MTGIETTTQGARLERLFKLMRKANLPETSLLSDEKVIELIHEIGSELYETLVAAGITLVANKPSKLDVAARPAFYLVEILSALALYFQPGPLLAQSALYKVSYVGDQLTWQFNAVAGNQSQEPADAAAIEFELLVRPPAAAAPNATGVRWYFTLNGVSQQAQNVTEVGSLYYVSVRARYVDANNQPRSIWSYSNEEIEANLPVAI